jgi:hypothetical protein
VESKLAMFPDPNVGRLTCEIVMPNPMATGVSPRIHPMTPPKRSTATIVGGHGLVSIGTIDGSDPHDCFPFRPRPQHVSGRAPQGSAFSLPSRFGTIHSQIGKLPI